MAPTIFADKQPPRIRSKRMKHTRYIQTAERNMTRFVGGSYFNSPVMPLFINYENQIKPHNDSLKNEDENVKITNNSSANKKQCTEMESNKGSDEISIEQMDTDDEEVHSIISSKSYGTFNQRWQMQELCKKNILNDPNKFYSNNNNNNNNNKEKTFAKIKPVAVFKMRTSDNKQINTANTSLQKIQNSKSTYADLCELKNAEGLLAIALKTIKLIKRNQLLQRRLAQLQMETSEFIASVLANPENRQFRDKTQHEHVDENQQKSLQKPEENKQTISDNSKNIR